MASHPRRPAILDEYDAVDVLTETRTVDAATFEDACAFNEQVVGIVAVAVVNDSEELLFIDHDGYGGWVLPGGRVEPGEDFEEAAVREVHEETGVEATVARPILGMRFVTRHDGHSTECFFVLFEGTAIRTETADDAGLDDEPITDVQWMDAIPAGTSEDETVQRTLQVVEDRFD